MRILVIEDNIGLNDAISEILRQEKYHVDSVFDGKDGYSDPYDRDGGGRSQSLRCVMGTYQLTQNVSADTSL